MFGGNLWNELFAICPVFILPLVIHNKFQSFLNKKHSWNKKSLMYITLRCWFICILGSLSVKSAPPALCHARWAASPSCACFLTRLKGCFWHLASINCTLIFMVMAYPATDCRLRFSVLCCVKLWVLHFIFIMTTTFSEPRGPIFTCVCVFCWCPNQWPLSLRFCLEEEIHIVI